MWQQSYTTTVQGIKPEQIWAIWADIPNRPAWDTDTQWAKANGPFANGTIITFKPKDWFKSVNMTIVECIPHKMFTDHTTFFLAELFGKHEMITTDQGLVLTTTITITGPLTGLWRRIVGQDIVDTLPEQTQQLIALAQSQS